MYVSTTAVDYLDRLDSKMTYCLLSETLNTACSLGQQMLLVLDSSVL